MRLSDTAEPPPRSRVECGPRDARHSWRRDAGGAWWCDCEPMSGLWRWPNIVSYANRAGGVLVTLPPALVSS